MSASDDRSSKTRERMLGAVPGEAALGRGPEPNGQYERHEYHHPASAAVQACIADRPRSQDYWLS
jgi:hypothetical protein